MSGWRRLGGLGLAVLLLAVGSGRAAVGLPAGWEQVPAELAALADPGARVVRVSARFLGTPYRPHTLIGSADLPEQLVAEFGGVDCFTLLDYVEALRRTVAPGDFRQRLIEVRYRDGVVAWAGRRHFFTDWAVAPGGRTIDVTAQIGGSRTQQTQKMLNRKGDGSLFLPGIAVQERTVQYIPAARLDSAVLDRLRPGDYLGIYAPEPGLDVSHVGIVVRQGSRQLLRHASSRGAAPRVIDRDLPAYLAGKPGIVVLRPQ
jgi:hypothetical protein